MGNSSSREARNSQDRGSSQSQTQSPTSPTFSFSINPPPNDRHGASYSSRGGRGTRPDLSLFSMGGTGEVDPSGQRRETKQEREARKLEKERVVRARERERSLREESVDGGYLVTLGTYVGIEDYSKSTVRQLQLERRLAPFWRGLNDHSDSWTEHQLVAAARGLPIPAPDQIPPQEDPPSPTDDRLNPSLPQTSGNLIPAAVNRGTSDTSLPALPPKNSILSSSPSSSTPSPLFRGRTKPLASLSSGKNISQPEIARQEIRLPKNPQVNGQPVEAYLYKDVGECPICFLYYPPYLNRTRCCDQAICSECFVQIKRPDPHPPEHTDPNSPPPESPVQLGADGEQQLVSEAATCPFCKMPELGITYDSPPFRRGLAYADNAQSAAHSLNVANGQAKRPRGKSMSATDPNVITTDTVRPDWAKKLSDARSHQARRSAAATALHTAAYMMNDRGSGFPGLGRRRRTNFVVEGSSARPEQMNPLHLEHLMAVLENQESTRRDRRGNSNSSDLPPHRGSSRANRPEDLEELMMMEAIRLSLQAEEERKKKEEKEAEKERKKEEKKRAKEQKKADKAARKTGTSSYSSSRNNSQYFSHGSGSADASQSPPETKGKGRAASSPAASARSRGYQPGGFTPIDEPTSTINQDAANQQRHDESRQHLEQTRADLSNERLGAQDAMPHTSSYTSLDSAQGESRDHAESEAASTAGFQLPAIPKTEDYEGAPENMFNFSSLNEMIDREHSEDSHPSAADDTRSRDTSYASTTEPPGYHPGNGTAQGRRDDVSSKHGGNVEVVGRTQET